MKKIKVLIGHRGVGKSSLLRRLKQAGLQADFVDLDDDISEHFSKSVSEIFSEKGEVFFRDQEIQVFSERVKKSRRETWIAIGGGFEIERLSTEILDLCEFIWVSRSSDERGRIFFDRPQLDPNLRPLEEFSSRRKMRDQRFLRFAHRRHWVPEGLGLEGFPPNPFLLATERLLLIDSDKIISLASGKSFFPESDKSVLDDDDLRADFSQFGWTLDASSLQSSERQLYLKENLQRAEFQFIEVRDDLLSRTQMAEAFQNIPHEKILFSFRLPENFEDSLSFLKISARGNLFGVDVDVESLSGDKLSFLSEIPAQKRILSSHGSRPPWELIDDTKWDSESFTYKWSPLIESFEELEKKLSSLRDRPVSFFPRSESGRWKWFRLLRAPFNEFNFLQMNVSTAPDQPSAMEVLSFDPRFDAFAAILGDPVDHSYSPVFHHAFFQLRKMNFLRIPFFLEEEPRALKLLEGLGLRAAAITSPLKKRFIDEVDDLDPEAELLQSVNTIVWQTQGWKGFNTDILGFSSVIDEMPSGSDEQFLLWGGGGTKSMVERVLGSRVISVSARTPDLKALESLSHEWVLIWASARSEETQFPPENLRIKQILDLNYTEDSMGRELALQRKIKYVSGLRMFISQAQAQQKIWSEYL